MVPGCGVAMTTMVDVTKKKVNVADSSSKPGKKTGGTTMMMLGHSWITMTTIVGVNKEKYNLACSSKI